MVTASPDRQWGYSLIVRNAYCGHNDRWGYNREMDNRQTVESIEQAALRLQPNARARLAHSLVDSLQALSREQLETLWLDEAERRDQEMESGKVKGIAGEKVFSRIEDKYSR
jgi:putative addiction module component (TIGR02574 family)